MSCSREINDFIAILSTKKTTKIMTQSDKCHALTFFTIKETRTRILESEQLVPEDVLNTAFREIDDVEQVENEEVENEVIDQSIVSRRPRITRYRTVAQIAEQLDNDENDISSNEDDDDYDDDDE